MTDRLTFPVGLWQRPFFERRPDRCMAWFWLVSRAAVAETTQDELGRRVRVPRGSFMTTRDQLARELEWTPKRVRVFLDQLAEIGAIERGRTTQLPTAGRATNGATDRKRKGHGRLLLTIRNYDTYCPPREARGHKSQSEGPQEGQQNKKTQESVESQRVVPDSRRGDRGSGGKGNELPLEPESREPSKPKASPASRGTRLPDDWTLPDDWRAYAQSVGLDELAIRRAEMDFRDHWHAKAGAAARKADWRATWQVWVRREADSLRGRRGGATNRGEPASVLASMSPKERADFERWQAQRRNQTADG